MGRFVGQSQLGNRGAWALVAVMAIVGLLGYEQYRWIVKVADAEERTNREKLETSLKGFRDDFDTEITRADLALAGLAGSSPEDVLEKARERLKIYRDLAEYPGLIASVEVSEGLPNPFEIAGGAAPVLAVAAGLIPTTRAAGGQYRGNYVALQPFAGVGPNLRARTGARPQFGGPPITVRIVLDQAYITGALLPALLDLHLGPNAGRRYDVLIRSGKNGAILQTGGNASSQWDVSLDMFSIRRNCLTDQADRGPITVDSRTTVSIEALLRRSRSCSDKDETGAPGIWTMNLRARPSLAESMASARRQNLWISFSVLLVLAVTVMILFVSTQRARELAALHKQFAAGVSHELRTPLSVISSASENLADGVVEDREQVRRYGRMIHSHSEELAAMVENALWFARGDAREGLEMEEAVPAELVREAAASCEGMLAQSGVVLERDVESGLPAIRGNRTLLLHGLQNLLANVALYGRAGKWARIRARRRAATVEFTIEDRGAGIMPEDITRVFQPFYRGKGAKQANIAGLGLGLAIVRRIVEAHDGEIELRSQHNAGTVVALRIPIFDADSQEPGEA
jgi:signal transduction histidine kinase